MLFWKEEEYVPTPINRIEEVLIEEDIGTWKVEVQLKCDDYDKDNEPAGEYIESLIKRFAADVVEFADRYTQDGKYLMKQNIGESHHHLPILLVCQKATWKRDKPILQYYMFSKPGWSIYNPESVARATWLP